MLKFFFACLLLANGVLFAYQRGYLDTLIPDGREPSRASRQLNADKIKIISPADAAAASASAATAASSTVVSNAPVSAIDPVVVEVEKKPEQLIACTEIGNFVEGDAVKFEKQLASLTLGDRLSRRKIEEVSSRKAARKARKKKRVNCAALASPISSSSRMKAVCNGAFRWASTRHRKRHKADWST